MQTHKVIYAKDQDQKDYFIKAAHNQKIIQIHRNKTISFDLNYKAINTLSTNAYTLYMYILMHNPCRIWALSSKEVFNNTPLKKRTYMNAIKELQDKKYLIPGAINLNNGETINTNTYHLWESAKNAPHPSSNLAPNGGA